jgi:hypothetical protein
MDDHLAKEIEEFKKNLFFCKRFNARVSLRTCKARKERGFIFLNGNFDEASINRKNQYSVDMLEECVKCDVDVGNIDIGERDFTVEDLKLFHDLKKAYKLSIYKDHQRTESLVNRKGLHSKGGVL